MPSCTILRQPSEVGAFYFALAGTPHFTPKFALTCILDGGILPDSALDNLVLETAIGFSSDFAYVYACADALTIVLDLGGATAIPTTTSKPTP